jgi:hypothetical protein
VRRVLSFSALLGLLVSLLPSVALAVSYSSAAAPTWIPNGQVWAMAVTPTHVYLGGDFTKLTNPVTGDSVSRRNLAAIVRSTGNPSSWRADVVENPQSGGLSGGYRTNPGVGALLVSGNTVYVGGDFTSIDGVDRNYAAAVSTAGTVLPFNPNPDGRVWDFVQDGSDLFMAGNFNKIPAGAGALGTRVGVGKVDATSGALVTGFDADVSGGFVQTMIRDDATLYLGGTFTGLGGAGNRDFLGAVNTGTGVATGFTPAQQCEDNLTDPDVICRVRDLATDGVRLFAAFGGEPGGRAAAWTIGGGDEPLWKHRADGEVQAVDYHDGVVYFGGHFSVRITEMVLAPPAAPAPGERHSRNQFYAAHPVTGDVLSYQLPTIDPATPGIRVIHADDAAVRVGGITQILNKPYRNFLTFAAAGVTIPGPTTAFSRIVVKTKGCKTCKVRLYEDRGSDAPWKSKWKKGKKGKTVFKVPTPKTVGLTVQVRAPWERRMTKTTEVVMRYKGKSPGQKVSAQKAAKSKKATSCWAGTVADSAKLVVATKRVVIGGKVATRAWAKTTKNYLSPMRKSKKGVLMVKKVTSCK